MKKYIVMLFLLMTANCWAFSVSKTQQLAAAIARAEGYGRKGAIPTRFCNPGDILAHTAHDYPGQIGISRKGHYAIFKNDAAGWAALRHQIDKIILGESKNYTVNMTLRQIGKRYATSSLWYKNVSRFLDVKPDTKLWEVLDVPPVLEKGWIV